MESVAQKDYFQPDVKEDLGHSPGEWKENIFLKQNQLYFKNMGL
jgi:hypothetical protein